MVSKSRNRTFIVLIAIFGIISFGIIKVGSEDLESYNVAIEDYGKFDDSWSLKPQKCDKEDPPLYDRAHVASNERFWSTIGDAEVKKLRSEWKSFVHNVPKRLPGGGKGIVYTCSSGIVKFALASIKLLRLYGCNLPIEVWYNGDELFKSHIDAFLAIPGVMPRDFKSIQSQVDLKQPEGDKMFEAKGAAILYSSFEQVIFMDSDVLLINYRICQSRTLHFCLIPNHFLKLVLYSGKTFGKQRQVIPFGEY